MGIVAGCLSPIFMGLSWAFQKRSVVIQSNVSPVVYQAYVAIGLLLTSFLALITGPAREPALGLLGGWTSGVSYICVMIAINHLGIGKTLAIVCSFSTIVGFTWGKVVFGESTKSIGWALAGLCTVIVGMGCLAYFVIGKDAQEDGATAEPASQEEKHPLRQPLQADSTKNSEPPAAPPEAAAEAPPAPAPAAAYSQVAYFWLALLGALFGGSCFAPLHGVDKEGGIGFLVWWSLGFTAVTLLVLSWNLLLSWRSSDYPALCGSTGGSSQLEFGFETIPSSLMQGTLFGFANACSVVAMMSPLGLAIATPLRECALVVGAVLGYCCFGEFRQPGALGAFIPCAALVLVGIVLLAVFGEED